ncbi:MAG: URC4/urg3 family protein [Myxococcaceae bacterium]
MNRNTALEVLLDPATIRARTRRIFELAQEGGTSFAVDLQKLPGVLDLVLQVTLETYPDGNIPYHGRFEHFRAGGVDRVGRVLDAITSESPVERARTLIDLVVVSVLLDAGAGDAWSYDENGTHYARSEGLALASLEMFQRGAFSDDPAHPLRVTAGGLERLTLDDVKRGFQVSDANPLAALEGRTGLLQRLATSLRAFPQYFGEGDGVPRPGNMIDALLRDSGGRPVEAKAILKLLLIGLSRMWPARVTCEGVGFGDVWTYGGDAFEQWVPFHKLSQWLTYSLIEPIESAGLAVTGVEELTGLPEYRNGGLFLDCGVLSLRDPSIAARPLKASDNVIIEWRALTVQLLDLVGERVCERMGRTRAELPLARVLQGGTWSAGRVVARRLRKGGGPPLTLLSDGMVF